MSEGKYQISDQCCHGCGDAVWDNSFKYCDDYYSWCDDCYDDAFGHMGMSEIDETRIINN